MSAAQVPGTPAPVVVPAADQPPAPAKEKTFAERWKEHGGEELDEPEAASETATTETAKPPAEKPTGPVTAGDKAMFEALAKKLGIKLDGGNIVKPSERISWENAKLRQEQGLAAREAKLKEAEAGIESSPRVKKAESVLAAFEAGDPDGFAAALGVKDFNEFQQSFLKRLADPNYGELRKLQQRVEQQEAEKTKAEQAAAERQQTEQKAAAYRSYMTTLSETAKASYDPLVAAMHDDPLFLQAVYRVQEKKWNKDTLSTCTVEEAIKEGLRGELKALYERLGRGFGSQSQESALTATGGKASNGKRPAPRTGITPAHSTPGGGAPKKPSEMTQLEWREHARKALEAAED